MSEDEKQAPQAPQASQASQATEIAETQEETEAPEEEKSTPSSPLGGRSVFAYLAVLFGAAFLLLLFAYLMQQRDSAEIMGNLSDLRASMGSIQSIDELTEENRQLREEKEALEEQVSDIQKQLDELEAELAGTQDEVNRWKEIYSESQATIDACCKVAQLKQLYEQGDIEEAKAFLNNIPESEHTKEMDEVEYRLSHNLTKFVTFENPDRSVTLLPYNPLLEEWQALKDALAEEEDAG